VLITKLCQFLLPHTINHLLTLLFLHLLALPFQVDRQGTFLTLVVGIGCAGMTASEIKTVRRLASGLLYPTDLES
jgi:hypothetical protein